MSIASSAMSDAALPLAARLLVATLVATGLAGVALARYMRARRIARQGRDFTQAILDNVQEVIFRTDADGRWRFLNPAWETITGYTVAQSLGWDSTRLLHEEDRAAAADVYPLLVAGKQQQATLRQRFFRASGECRHIEVRMRRLCDADGAFAGTTGNIRDITEHVRQERALRESEERFRRMAEAAPVGIYRADEAGNLSYLNPAWSAKLGLTPEQALGAGWKAMLDGDMPFEEGPTVFGDRAPGAIRRRVMRFRNRDGKLLWGETISAPEHDADGKIAGFVGVIHDVTAQRLAEAELVARDEQLTLLANNATDGVFRFARDGTCRYASPSVRGLIGRDPAEIIGGNLITAVCPEDVPIVETMFGELASGASEKAVIAFRPCIGGDGPEPRWLEGHCGLVRDADGNPSEIIASVRDITRTKILEAALVQARETAEAGAAAKAAFLAHMSHEIRTPMNGVLGFTDLLAATKLDRNQRQHVQMIADSGRAMMRLLNDILDISRIEAGRLGICAEPVDLAHKLRNCVMLVAPLTRSKGVTLGVEIDPALPRQIVIDPLRLRQIVLNLLGNAAKFTPQGAVTLRACRRDDRLVVTVSDTGIGIAADRHAAIFDQFAQADTAIARDFGGSGLGLPISAELARLMGGSIAVESRLGVGTTFSIDLPLVAEDETIAETVVAKVAATNDEPRRHRVLVAEDNAVNQQLMQGMAVSLGVEATIAADGAEAVALVKRARAANRPFDLVLMDVRMPRMDGIEATRHIRAAGCDAATLPIVAVTANAYDDDIAAALAAGMQAHLAKPVRLDALRDLFGRFIGTGKGQGADDEDVALDALRGRYERDRDAVLARIAGGAYGSGDRDEMIGCAHDLAGLAGLFGDHALGQAAAVLERNLRDAPDGTWRNVLRAANDGLRQTGGRPGLCTVAR